MAKRRFDFELYRINLIQAEPSLFDKANNPIITDADIAAVLENATLPKYTIEFSGRVNSFQWALRDFLQYAHDRSDGSAVYGITLAKSVIQSAGEFVTDTGIEEGVSGAEPPLADTCHLFFYMKRHLVAVERRSSIINSRWRLAIQGILKQAASDLSYSGWIELEPVPRHEEIFEAFRSFSRLTRLRVVLRLPNPELSRYSKNLYDEMENGSIREYLQDMKNPQGLSQSEGHLPHATTEIAAAGYKQGEVTFEGIRNQKRDTVKTGNAAARGQIDKIRDYVRGMKDVVRTKESQNVTTAILDEIDRIAPPPEGEASS